MQLSVIISVSVQLNIHALPDMVFTLNHYKGSQKLNVSCACFICPILFRYVSMCFVSAKSTCYCIWYPINNSLIVQVFSDVPVIAYFQAIKHHNRGESLRSIIANTTRCANDECRDMQLNK